MFFTPAEINAGSLIHLKVLLPSESQPVTVKGILKWIEKKGEFFIGGIEWLRISKNTRQITN